MKMQRDCQDYKLPHTKSNNDGWLDGKEKRCWLLGKGEGGGV
jgi:hypothetical protein